MSVEEAPRLFPTGFLCPFGMLTLEDDLNTYAHYLMVKPERLKDLSERYPLIARKADILRRFYQMIGFRPPRKRQVPP